MMTYHWTWKTVVILSYGIDTRRTLFLAPKDVSLREVNPAAQQIPLKGSGFVSGLRVLLVSGVLSGRPLLACMHHPQQHVMSLCLVLMLYSTLPSGSGTWRSGPWWIGLIAEGTSGYWIYCLLFAIYSF